LLYEGNMDTFALAFAHYLYSRLENFDDVYDNFLKSVYHRLNLNSQEHLRILINWLNKWGCRHIALSAHENLAINLNHWWVGNQEIFKSITSIQDEVSIVKVFNSLSKVCVMKDSKKSISFGPTATSKTLFALNQDFFLPWDLNIRKGYSNDGQGYYKFLKHSHYEFQSMIKNLNKTGIDWKKIKLKLFPYQISDMKLIDEYYWISKTKGIGITKEELSEMMQNAK